MRCLSRVPPSSSSSSSSSPLCSLPALLGVSVCGGSPAGLRVLLLPPAAVGRVQLSVLDLLSGSSLLSPPHHHHLLFLLLLTPPPALLPHLLPVTGGGGSEERSPRSLSALGEGGVGLGVPALGHGEIPQRPLLVAGRGAGSLLLGRDVGDGGGLPWTEAVIAGRDGYCGDGGLRGDGCHGADQGGGQRLQFDLAAVFQLQGQQESRQTFRFLG